MSFVTDDEWLIVGSSPRAKEYMEAVDWRRSPRIAAVNGSYKLLDRPPDAYGVFELKAIEYYGHVADSFAEQGVDIHSWFKWGPENLKCEHATYNYKLGYPKNKCPYHRAQGLGMGSATLMMLIVGLVYKPKTIYMVGSDGYWPDAVYDKDVDVCPETDIDLSLDLCQTTNRYASWHVSKITNLAQFADIDVCWVGNPIHPEREPWNVRYLVPQKAEVVDD